MFLRNCGLTVVFCVSFCLATTVHADATLIFEDTFDRPDSLDVGNGWVEEGEAMEEYLVNGYKHYPAFTGIFDSALGFRYTRPSTVEESYAARPTVSRKLTESNPNSFSFSFVPSDFGRVNFEIGLMESSGGFVNVLSTRGESDNSFELIKIPRNGVGISLLRSDGKTNNSGFSISFHRDGGETVLFSKNNLSFQFLPRTTYTIEIIFTKEKTSLSIKSNESTLYSNITLPAISDTLALDQIFLTDTQMGVLPGTTDTTLFPTLSVFGTIATTTSPAPTSTPPTITLVGEATVRVPVGGVYEEQGVTAFDAEDGPLATSSITISGNPDTSLVGTSTVLYTVSDSSLLLASTTRTVVVYATSTPPSEEGTTTPPTATTTPPTATTTPFASTSIVFFPGITGSQLFHRDDEGNEDKLWDSLLFSDLNYLKMNEAGGSEHDDIYARGLVENIASATGLWNYREVYAGWKSFLNSLRDRKVIAEWDAVPYDWRLATDELIGTGHAYESGTSFLGEARESTVIEETVRRMASSSPSGKVTLIGHSNGGLVIKNWLRSLEEKNSPLLSAIETVLLIGSPQTGTPETLTTLLHGTIPAFSTTRDVLEEMPGMFGLIPSEAFFTKAPSSAIRFDWTLRHNEVFASYASTSITTYSALETFLKGGEEKRSKPSKTNTNTPNVLGSGLLTDAKTMHSTIDSWRAPHGIRSLELAGDGLATVNGIRYFLEDGRDELLRELLFSSRGDGTVLAESAEAGDMDETYFMYFDTYNELEDTNYKHGTMLSAPPVQTFVEHLVRGESLASFYILPNKSTAIKKRFSLQMRSPVAVHLYDSSGKHTGVLSGSAGDAGQLFEEEIPNSYYREWGEVKYAGAGLERGEVTVHLEGLETGTFTLILDSYEGEEVVRTDTFTHIPTMAHASGTLVMRTGEAPTLLYDIDNDGVLDASLRSGESFVWPPIPPKDGGAGSPLFSRGAGGAGDTSLPKKDEHATTTKTALFTENLGFGMKNEQVRLLQTRLRAEGFFSQESTGFFDEETRSAVCAFQEAHPSIFYRTGFVGPRTRAVLHGGEPEKEPYTLSRTLTHGARGDEVFLAQALLRVQGFFHFPYETGYFGELTQAGVRAFQKARGLAETGELDAETRVLLGK